jgi:hypothetical protein
MALHIRKAERRKAKLRLALIGPTGSGKTYSALKLAFGIGGKIGMVDTEHGSGDLYADLGDYDVISLEPPYTVPKYREAISTFEHAGYDVIIVDSLTHAWAGEGGLLDKQGQLEKDTARFKNSFQTWREITPEHNKLVEELIGSPAHMIATLRVKTEYVMEQNSRGKMEPRKIGLAPVFRDGIEYEFTLCMDVDQDHYARASKDRTMLFSGWRDQITEEVGRKLKGWLESGADIPPASAHKEPGRTDAQWQVWLDKLRGALATLYRRSEIVDMAGRKSIADASADGPPWVRREIASMLAEAYARFPEDEPPTEDDGDAAHEPETEAV